MTHTFKKKKKTKNIKNEKIDCVAVEENVLKIHVKKHRK
jgi:hypothetical protein